MLPPPQFARGLDVPLEADSVDAPIVQYGGEMTAIHFRTREGRWGRIAFERLDSLRVTRGEYQPFPSVPDDRPGYHWATTISNSGWLRERYEYERRHYGNAYKFIVSWLLAVALACNGPRSHVQTPCVVPCAHFLSGRGGICG